MGQTLSHGVYLPNEGERNCYAGLASNWQILNTAVGAIAEKAPLVHTHTKADITDFPAYGTTAGTICEGNDSRLSDARTPVAHTHTKADVTDLLNSNFIPSANNSYDLGSSSNQWNNLYAKNYYYNGTAWGLDKQNEWTNFQRMTSNPAVWYLRNNTVTLGSAPSSNRYLGIFFEDVNGVELGNVHYQAAKNGYNSITFSLRNSDGTNTYTGALRYRASTTGDYCFFPETSECDLGISTNQWKSVYAQSYYYNGVAWGLDKANVWTGRNQFNNLSLYSNDVTYNQAPSSNIELPSIRIMGGGRYCGAFDYVWRSTGENVIRLSLGSFTSAGSFGYWACNFGIPRDFSDGGKFGTPAFYPNTSGGYDLGTSTAKWKSLNGNNPGALSLPNLASDSYIDLSDNISANTEYSYTPTVDGWLALYCQTTGFHAENAVGIFTGGGSSNSYRWACSVTSAINLQRASKYHGVVMLPVKAGIPYLCWITVNSSTTLSTTRLYFYKATGNV